MDLVAELRILFASALLFSGMLTAGSSRFGGVLKGSYLISTFHAVTVLILAGAILFSECWENVTHSCTFDSRLNTDLQQITLLYSMGYFIVDSAVVLWLSPDVSASLHHLSILVGQAATIFNGEFDATPVDRFFSYAGVSGYPLVCFLFAAELSAPFLNAFLSGFTPKNSQSEFIAKALFAFTFLVSRLLVCPFLTYEFVVNSPNAPLIPKAVCVFVMGISVYWSKAIITGILEVVNPPKASKLENVIGEGPDGRLKGQ